MANKKNHLFIKRKEVNGKIKEEYIGIEHEDAIKELAKEFGFECRIMQGVIMVKTNIGWWAISINTGNNKIADVYHGNFRCFESIKEQSLKGFHNQRMRDLHRKKLPFIFNYIKHHDEKFTKKLRSESKMDKLFKQIEQERK